jgi:antitoxin (DNA-binding transcriptional repressor) of toxin-antitoxin stability system
MKLNRELEDAIRRGLDELIGRIRPGTSVVIRVNGSPAAVLVLCAKCENRPALTAFDPGYFDWLESRPDDN